METKRVRRLFNYLFNYLFNNLFNYFFNNCGRLKNLQKYNYSKRKIKAMIFMSSYLKLLDRQMQSQIYMRRKEIEIKRERERKGPTTTYQIVIKM